MTLPVQFSDVAPRKTRLARLPTRKYSSKTSTVCDHRGLAYKTFIYLFILHQTPVKWLPWGSFLLTNFPLLQCFKRLYTFACRFFFFLPAKLQTQGNEHDYKA